MICAHCGQMLPQGAAVCPVCGAPVNAAYGQPPAAQPTVYQQSWMPYQPNSYPTGYQQAYQYDMSMSRPDNSLLTRLSELPRAFLESFVRPGEVLRAMVERRDVVSCLLVTVLVLALSFVGGMVIMRGFIGVLFSAVSALTGVSMAGSAASMNQGISYIAGRIAPAVGGVAALCQFICMLVPAVVYMVYICGICKVAFSWELALGFATVCSLNTAAVALLAMALSLLSPWASVLVMLCGMMISYVKANSMLSLITARPDAQLVRAKIILTALAVLLSLTAAGAAGGLLMSGVMRRVLMLLSSVGSLI